MSQLEFKEIITNNIIIDEYIINEYLEEHNIINIDCDFSKDDFISWLNENYYLEDFIINNNVKYSLSNDDLQNCIIELTQDISDYEEEDD